MIPKNSIIWRCICYDHFSNSVRTSLYPVVHNYMVDKIDSFPCQLVVNSYISDIASWNLAFLRALCKLVPLNKWTSHTSLGNPLSSIYEGNTIWIDIDYWSLPHIHSLAEACETVIALKFVRNVLVLALSKCWEETALTLDGYYIDEIAKRNLHVSSKYSNTLP